MNFRGEANKQPMLDQSDYMIEFSGQRLRFDRGVEGAIEDVMASVADEEVAVGISTQCRTSAQGRQLTGGCFPAELNHFDGHREFRSEAGDQLAFVNHNNEAAAHAGDDFFPQQRAAVAFNQIQCSLLDLIGTVDSHLDPRHVSEAGERNSQGSSLRGGIFRCRNADESKTLTHSSAESLDSERGRGTGTESDDHAVRYQRSRRFRSGGFQ